VKQLDMLNPFYWDEFYDRGNDWGRPRATILKVARELQQAFGTPEIRVLDLACGNGRYTIPLAELGARVDCVDFSRVAIDQLQARAARNHVLDLVRAQCEDVRRFIVVPFSYHLVLASGLFEYLEEQELRAVIRRVQTGTVAGGINALIWLQQHPQAAVIPNEYPVARGLIEKIYASSAEWQVMAVHADLKEDYHPLEAGGEPQKHIHSIGRMLAKRIGQLAPSSTSEAGSSSD